MKYLKDYTEKAQTKLFKRTGTLFAFSQDKFQEQRKEGEKYVGLGSGIYVIERNAETLVKGLNKIQAKGIKEDIKANGIEAIILRELNNHEAYYDGDTERTFEALEEYGITHDEVKKMYRNKKTILNNRA